MRQQGQVGCATRRFATRSRADKFLCKTSGGISPLRKYAEEDLDKEVRREGGAMPEQERSEAIKRFQAHEVEVYRRSVEWDRQRKEDLAKWKSVTLTTIYQSVQGVSDDFAERGSPFLFSPVPMQPESSAVFRIKTDAGVRLFAKLQFDLADGQVTATSTVAGVEFLSSVPGGDVTREWVELVAERVLIAMLNAALGNTGRASALGQEV